MVSEINHEMRSHGIGSSEIAMLVLDSEGNPLSPFGGPHKLWRKKTGQEIPEDEGEKPWLDRGHFIEPALLAWYAKRETKRIRAKPGTMRSTKYPYIVDSVDALAWDAGNEGKKPDRCVEAKTTIFYKRHEWGAPGTDQVPKYYHVQGQHHMTAWSLGLCDYPAFWGDDLNTYTTVHDEELSLALVAIAEKFWVDHVKANKAPPVDGSDATGQWLARKLEMRDEKIRQANAVEIEKMIRYRDLRLLVDKGGEELATLENEIKSMIGPDQGIAVPGFPKLKITFNTVAGKSKIEVDAVIKEILDEREHLLKTLGELAKGMDPGMRLAADTELRLTRLNLEELKAKHTKKGEGYRRWYATSLLNNDVPPELAPKPAEVKP